MALMTCPECGKKISDKAERCIQCGYPLKSGKGRIVFILCAVIAVLFFVIIVAFSWRDDDEEGNPVVDSMTKQESQDNSILEIQEEIDPEKVDVVPENPQNYNENENQISIGKYQRISVDEICEFVVTGYNVNKTIEPPDPDGYYSYYEADDGNVFVDTIFKIKNLQTTEVIQDSIVDSVKLLYDDKYVYNCFIITEKNNGNDFNKYSSLYGINPLETLNYHMLVELPSEVKSNSKSLKVIIEVDGNEYVCILRG